MDVTELMPKYLSKYMWIYVCHTKIALWVGGIITQ